MDRKQDKKNSVLIIAAEASSIAYAQRLLKLWKSQGKDYDAFGVGCVEMERMGFRRLGKSEDMAVVGFSEILSHYSDIKKVFYDIVEEAKRCRPKVVLLMDYPGFNLRLAKEMHQLGFPVVYYIAPQIWAWKQNRVEIIKKYCDQVFLIFPFELPFYSQHGVRFEFVGNPILEDLDSQVLNLDYQKQKRRRLGIQDHELVLGLMPGSRRIEIKNHLRTQLETAQRIQQQVKDLRVVVLVAPTVQRQQIEEILEDFSFPVLILQDKPFEMIAITDLVLVASGTATLMVGLLEKPMVIMYKTSWLTSVIARFVVKGFFGLVNLILGEEAVPEIFQDQANPSKLSELLLRYVQDLEYKNSVVNKLKKIPHLLGEYGATERVAQALDGYFQGSSSSGIKTGTSSLVSTSSTALSAPYKNSKKAWPLHVMEKFYFQGTWLKHWLYKKGIFRQAQLNVPIISVGNLAFGGSGKTPFVQWLCRYLQPNYPALAVISKSYQGQVSEAAQVELQNSKAALKYGDEPVLLAETLPGLDVFAGPTKYKAAELAVSSRKYDFLILDDGFQHFALKRDLDIVLVSVVEGLRVLKREDWPSLKRADVVVLTQCQEGEDPSFESWIRSCISKKALIFKAYTEVEMPSLKDLKALSFSSIAKDFLFKKKINADEPAYHEHLAYADHYQYQQSDFDWIQEKSKNFDVVLTTEKDFVKLRPYLKDNSSDKNSKERSVKIDCVKLTLKITGPLEQLEKRLREIHL